MGMLRDHMIETLKLKRCQQNTIDCYVRSVRDLANFHRGRSLLKLGEDDIRSYLLDLVEVRRLSPSTHAQRVAGIKFFYRTTAKLPDVVAGIPSPKVPLRLPVRLTSDEIEKLLGCITSIKHRALCTLAYDSGLRINEACPLQVPDIDSEQMLVHVRHGKGNKARDARLGEQTLELLRECWRAIKPTGTYLFPGQVPGKPITSTAVANALRRAAKAAGIKKRVSPHVLRHSFAVHHLEMGTDILTIQALLGHSSYETTLHYARVSVALLTKTKTPLDARRLQRKAPPVHP